jgi:hypothetical protein
MVRTLRRHVALAAALLLRGVVTGLVLTADDPTRFYALVGRVYAQGRTPAATTEELRAALYDHGPPGGQAGRLRHVPLHPQREGGHDVRGARVRGRRARGPAALHNGLLLGAFAALYQQRSLGLEFWAWILPHGITELLAVVLCGAAGLSVGEALLFPGRHTRLRNLGLRGRRRGRRWCWRRVMLLCAGLIEGVFRQTVHSVEIRCWWRRLTGARLDRLLHDAPQARARYEHAIGGSPARADASAWCLTPEGVPLRFTPGGRGGARGAFLLDLAILFVACIVVLDRHADPRGRGGAASASRQGLVAFFVLRTFYFTFFECGASGATPASAPCGSAWSTAHGGALTAEAVLRAEPDARDRVLRAARGPAGARAAWATRCRLGAARLARLAAGLRVAAALQPRPAAAGRPGGRHDRGAGARARCCCPTSDGRRSGTAGARAGLSPSPASSSTVYGIYELQVLEDLLRSSGGRARGVHPRRRREGARPHRLGRGRWRRPRLEALPARVLHRAARAPRAEDAARRSARSASAPPYSKTLTSSSRPTPSRFMPQLVVPTAAERGLQALEGDEHDGQGDRRQLPQPRRAAALATTATTTLRRTRTRPRSCPITSRHGERRRRRVPEVRSWLRLRALGGARLLDDRHRHRHPVHAHHQDAGHDAEDEPRSSSDADHQADHEHASQARQSRPARSRRPRASRPGGGASRRRSARR